MALQRALDGEQGRVGVYHCVCVPIGDGWPKESTTVAGEGRLTDGSADGCGVRWSVYHMAARRGMGCGDPWLQKPFDVVPHSTHADINIQHFLFSIRPLFPSQQ
jgi:hypothetical protein